jgi:hypothetical protein
VLDRRRGHESLPPSLLPAAVAALKKRLTTVHTKLCAEHARAVEQWRIARERDLALAQQANPVDHEAGLNRHIAAARSAQVQLHVHDPNLLQRLFGAGADGAEGDQERDARRGAPLADFRSVDAELKELFALPRLHETGNAMLVFHKNSPHKLVLAREVALDVLSAPAGEAHRFGG